MIDPSRFRGRVMDDPRTLDPELWRIIKPYTMSPEHVTAMLLRLLDRLNRLQVAGDVVECGVCAGGSAAVLATQLVEPHHLWLYDSFQGLPTPRTIDGPDAPPMKGKLHATAAQVREVLAKVGLAEDRYTIREGWFEDAFTQPLPQAIALLHCDADWYDSVLLTLRTLEPRVVEGGCIVLDDFGWWEGAREAFYDYCIETGQRPLLERNAAGQAFWIKGRDHNREAFWPST